MMYWPDMPIFKLVLPVVAGIAAGSVWNFPTGWLWLACVAGLVLLLVLHFRARQWHQRHWFGAVLWAEGLLLGMGLAAGRQAPSCEADPVGQAHVAEVLERFPSRSSWQRFRVKTEYRLQSGGYWTRSGSRLELYIHRDSASALLQPGDRLLFTSDLRCIESGGNPEAFDYRAYLARKHIHHQAFLGRGTWMAIPDGATFSWRRALHRLRINALGRLKQALPDTASYGLAAALLLGSKGQLPRELKESYSEVGVAHVLAVSGLHVGILAFGLLFLLQRLPIRPDRRKPIALWTSLSVLVVYAFLTGMPASVQRAVLMYSIVLAGRFTRLKGNSYNSLGVAALLMLSTDAALLHDLGFQYSFLALLGILFFHPFLARAVLITQPLLRKLWDLTVLGVAANLTTFPLTLFYFHEFPVYFWLSSLLITFLVTGILYGGFVFLLLGGIPLLGDWLGRLLAWMLQWSNDLVLGFTRLPGHTLTGVWLETGDLILLYGAVGSTAVALAARRKTGWYLALGFLLVATCSGLIRGLQAVQHREVVIYRLGGGQTALDLIEGRRVYGLVEGDPSSRQLGYVRDNYRLKRRIREHSDFDLSSASMASARVNVRSGCIQFYGWEMAVLDGLGGRPPAHPLPLDALLWKGRQVPEPDRLARWVQTDHIVLDGSLPAWLAEQCRRALSDGPWEIHSIPHEGAFRYTISNR